MHKYRIATTRLLKTFHSTLPAVCEENNVRHSPILKRIAFSTSSSRDYHSGGSDGKKPGIILGIETSCDDTGAAVVTTDRRVLGESLHSQLQIHLKYIIFSSDVFLA